MNQFHLISSDNIQVAAYSWLPKEKPVAVMQIVHGMQEHAGRYDKFARWLNERGIAVYAEDHIGHGKTAENEKELSHFPRKDDWQRQVELLHELTLVIKSEHPGLPVIILGHSMGSVLLQTYMIRYGYEADGYILSGAIRQTLFMANAGILLVKVLSFLFGSEDRSKLIVRMGYGQYNKRFMPMRTKCDWLCRDEMIVDEYLASPLCGKRLTNMFYYNFFQGFRIIAQPKNLAKIPSGKPVLIIAGQEDAAGFFGKAPLKIKELLTRYAKASIELKLFAGARHEVLNETNKEEVYNEIILWTQEMLNVQC